MDFVHVTRLVINRRLLAIIAAVMLAACGGGGSGDTSSAPRLVSGGQNPEWKQGTYAPSATYAAQCALPRMGINPATGSAYADKQGSTVLENFWLRSWTHEFYLWYRDVVDRDPAVYGSTSTYFDTQKSTATTNSGRPRDQFHFTYDTAQWIALSQSGITVGYGLEWTIVSSTIPRVVQVAYTEPNSPATNAGLTRGAKVLAVDGVSIDTNSSSGIATLNAGLSPAGANETHSFQIQELNGVQHTVQLTATAVTSVPVQNVKTIPTTSGAIGYMLFNDHIATSEQLLVAAFAQLQQTSVSDLVLDLRYNGGGYLDIASEVAYMVAGSTATSGKTFERTVFNDQYAATLDPLTGGSNTPVPFHSTTLGFSVAAGAALPTLNLPRVFVITGSNTCSASESIINGLRGIGVTVVQIGVSTCGKPYGFYPQDNCGTTYFSIQFQGVNEAGFGDYADGFSPDNSAGGVGELLPGCAVADDLGHALGDTAESRLAAALFYRSNGYCSPGISSASQPQIQQLSAGAVESEPLMLPSQPWRNNRIISPGAP